VVGASGTLALVIQHSPLAHLGGFAAVLADRGWQVRIVEAPGLAGLTDDADLVIVLGGDEAVYEQDAHPYLATEVEFLRRRLEAERPTLGVCLGAQLMAEALGGRVSRGKSDVIGFRRVDLTDAGKDSPLRHLAGVPLMQWHGDSFRLPAGATRLASSAEYSNEAFRMGDYALAVQFHPELIGAMYEQWIADGAGELAALAIDPDDLRAQRDEHAAAMEVAAAAMLGEWLDTLRS
jgi:GMP synthase (glutamine-hydrolysing)